MPYKLTDQQQEIVDQVLNPSKPVITVNAVAGASKSFTLQKAAAAFKEANPKGTFRYLVYGRMAADEAKLAFKHNAIVSNLHQLAYHYTIRQSNMHLLKDSAYLAWYHIPKHIKQPFGKTPEALMLIQNFCESNEISFDTFCSNSNSDYSVQKLANEVMYEMHEGNMPCTHDFYLKVFHMEVMTGETQLEQVDILAVDECQDLSPITLDIIKAYPAKLKVLVGDPYQAVFSFMGCVNAFDHFPEAYKLNLSKSFRCNSELAKLVKEFGQNTFDPSFDFEGITYNNNEPITSKAYLTRTNSALIGKMIELNKSNTSYKLSTASKINQIFDLPLALLRCKPGNKEKNPKFKRMQKAADDWGRSAKLQQTISRMKYIASIFPENPEIPSAIRMIMKYGPDNVIDAYTHAKEHVNSSSSLQLCTIHTSKGATYDEVELADDANESITDIIKHINSLRSKGLEPALSTEDLAELYLYYVACTRARHNVLNANYLFKEYTTHD